MIHIQAMTPINPPCPSGAQRRRTTTQLCTATHRTDVGSIRPSLNRPTRAPRRRSASSNPTPRRARRRAAVTAMCAATPAVWLAAAATLTQGSPFTLAVLDQKQRVAAGNRMFLRIRGRCATARPGRRRRKNGRHRRRAGAQQRVERTACSVTMLNPQKNGKHSVIVKTAAASPYAM